VPRAAVGFLYFPPRAGRFSLPFGPRGVRSSSVIFSCASSWCLRRMNFRDILDAVDGVEDFSGRPRTGELTGLQYLSSKPPPSDSGLRMSYFCTAMVSEVLSWSTRCREVRRLRTPVAEGSLGLSGKTSKTPRPRYLRGFVMVAWRYASVTP